MSRTFTLFMYKIRFFFGPSLRGRLGPLAFIGLIVLFVPTGFGLGFAVGEGMKGVPAAQGINVLSSPLSGLLAIGLLYGIFSGVTAHASEFDFFMTADVRPREYLASDLVFQFASLFGAGGLAAIVAGFGIVSALARPLWTVAPLLAMLLAFAFLILMVIQLVVILAVRYPKAPVRWLAGLVLLLSLLPAVSLAYPPFPLRFEGLPIPATAFATLGYDVVMGLPFDLVSVVVAGATFLVIAGAWVAVSDTYLFHGIHPSLSAGFGQVDMAARMAQQQRLTAGLGRFTTRIRVRTDRGSDTSLMTRFHLVRIVRDGSLIYVVLFAFISIAIQVSGTGSPQQNTRLPLIAIYILTFLPALLALNWSYYERENLWIVVTSAKTPGAYFRGLMMSLMAIGLVGAAAFLPVYEAASQSSLPLSGVALPLAAPIGAALMATALLTRLKVQPAAFSLSMLAILFLVVVAGYLGGFGAQGVLIAGEAALGLGGLGQASLLVAYCTGLTAFGLWWVSRLASGFRL